MTTHIHAALIFSLAALAGCSPSVDAPTLAPETTTGPAWTPIKVYTPEQLRKMEQTGALPSLGPQTRTTVGSRFDVCQGFGRTLVQASAPTYPTGPVIDTPHQFIGSVWTNDGKVTVACTSIDRLQTVIKEPYSS